MSWYPLLLIAWLISAASSVATAQPAAKVEAPRFWNDRGLSDWATPIAALNVRPGHYSESAYYAAPAAEWVRTYPVYAPWREPPGYWDMLRRKKPEPLVTPGARTAAEWIEAGKRVFHEMDQPFLRTYDPDRIATMRSAKAVEGLDAHAMKDGTLYSLRWVVTSKGIALSMQNCAECHSRTMPDGSLLDGGPFNHPRDKVAGAALSAKALPELLSPGENPVLALARQFRVPWERNDINRLLETEPGSDAGDFGMPVGVLARFNGSPFYPTKVPDLIGLRDRKYIDHTATHRLRGVEDVMRYAALISCCDIADFGPYRILSDSGRRIVYRFPDEVLFALVQYLFALPEPPNPNRGDPLAGRGKEVFDREGCTRCHTPPLYTNNKLTLATGFTPPPDHPLRPDIMAVSVGTDPNLALKTRKGTGFYKVPSLKGLWYRGFLNHDGSVATLEEWFDPARLRDDYKPSGFLGYKTTHRAVPGHEFGLSLNAQDKAALIAFLRTL